MKPQPKSKSDDIIERINRLSSDDIKNPFIIGGIKRDVETWKESHAIDAYMVLGMLACLENKIDEMRDYHEKAIRISSDFNSNLNYATSLAKKGFFNEAQKCALKAHEFNPGDMHCLSVIVQNNVDKGRCREAFDWLEKFEKTFPDKNLDIGKFILSSNALLTKYQILDDDVEHIEKIAISLLHNKGFYHIEIFCRLLQDEDSEWISYQIGVGLPPDEVVGLNVELAKKLARENLPANVTNRINVMYTSQN